MRTIKLVVEYDGTRYYGWQRQKGQPSIQQTLEDAIRIVTREEVTVIGSGRTDTGVHALNQVAHFKVAGALSEERLKSAINGLLPDDIVIKQLGVADATFHARFDAKSKQYIYQIWNHPDGTAIHRQYYWTICRGLDVEKMRQAAAFLVGARDFSSFCGSGSKVRDYTRTMHTVLIERDERGRMRITLNADGFLRHMVRNIVGTLVEVGRGRITPQDFKTILDSRDRTKAGITAPARGLFLAQVNY